MRTWPGPGGAASTSSKRSTSGPPVAWKRKALGMQAAIGEWRMFRPSGRRFADKNMRKSKNREHLRFRRNGTCSGEQGTNRLSSLVAARYVAVRLLAER